MDAFPRVHWQCRIAFFDPSADHALYPHRLVEQKHMRQTAAALLECGLIQMQQRIGEVGWMGAAPCGGNPFSAAGQMLQQRARFSFFRFTADSQCDGNGPLKMIEFSVWKVLEINQFAVPLAANLADVLCPVAEWIGNCQIFVSIIRMIVIAMMHFGVLWAESAKDASIIALGEHHRPLGLVFGICGLHARVVLPPNLAFDRKHERPIPARENAGACCIHGDRMYFELGNFLMTYGDASVTNEEMPLFVVRTNQKFKRRCL